MAIWKRTLHTGSAAGLGLALLALAAVGPLTAFGAERMVICEEFTNLG